MERAMGTVKVIDYAYPTMMAERALKDMHNAALERKWEKAQEHALEANSWIAKAIATLMVAELKESSK